MSTDYRLLASTDYRLLASSDLALHLREHADDPRCTVVLMDDMNVDRDRDQGTDDARSL